MTDLSESLRDRPALEITQQVIEDAAALLRSFDREVDDEYEMASSIYAIIAPV